ncbi:MAG: nitroreductase family protein [Elusimicrobiaceae bacterium]|nr:nitroreductase family protein [Elusimicrobiaceae bacterium]
MKHEFLDLIKLRRSRYDLTNKSTLPKEELVKLLQTCVLHTPSPFNSQSSRMVLLCDARHRQFWQIVKHELQAIIPPEKFVPTEEKLASFAAAYGTILFFEDWSVVESLQAQFPAYKDNFPRWAYQANAMTEFAVWSALAENGMGASLQHYNPLIDWEVHRQFHIPLDWKLIAQMPFGVALSEHAPDKTFLPIEQRVHVACP